MFKKLVCLDKAIDILKSNASPITDVEVVCLRDALGRVLAEDIIAGVDIPPFDRAAMDGYAIIAEDTIGASVENPRILKVVGESDIGRPYRGRVLRGEAVYVHTGSVIPEGADAVVPVEYTKLDGVLLYVYASVASNDNISRRGEDVRRGEKVLESGTLLEPFDIALIKALGMRRVKVYRKPKVSVLACGSELVDNPEELAPGKILEYSREIVIGLAKKFGCEAIDLGICPDDKQELRRYIIRASEVSDILVTVGGTSIGKHDIVPKVLEGIGRLLFHGVAIQPGKPVCAGKIGEFLVLGLPGLPVSTFVCGITLLRSVIERMSNIRGEIVLPTLRARLSRGIWSKVGVRTFARVRIRRTKENYIAEPIMVSGSGVLSSLVLGDGIVIVEENLEGIPEGILVDVVLLRNFLRNSTKHFGD